MINTAKTTLANLKIRERFLRALLENTVTRLRETELAEEYTDLLFACGEILEELNALDTSRRGVADSWRQRLLDGEAHE